MNATEPVFTLKHVFVSYAHEDADQANKIVEGLRTHNINTWIDKTGIPKDSLNWQKAIRQAVKASFAVILLASPSSAVSDVIHSELSIARDENRPIYVMWVKGEKESESIPIGFTAAQRIDVREKKLDLGIQEISDILSILLDRIYPSLLCVEEDLFMRIDLPHLKSRYLIISNKRANNFILVRTNAYTSLRYLLDELYMNYLRDDYRSFTYGADWILVRTGSTNIGHLIIAPFDWLLNADKPITGINPSWENASLEAIGLISGTQWRIGKPKPEGYRVILTNNQLLANSILEVNPSNSKALYLLFKELFDEIQSHHNNRYSHQLGEITINKLTDINSDGYKYQFILEWPRDRTINDIIVFDGPWPPDSDDVNIRNFFYDIRR